MNRRGFLGGLFGAVAVAPLAVVVSKEAIAANGYCDGPIHPARIMDAHIYDANIINIEGGKIATETILAEKIHISGSTTLKDWRYYGGNRLPKHY